MRVANDGLAHQGFFDGLKIPRTAGILLEGFDPAGSLLLFFSASSIQVHLRVVRARKFVSCYRCDHRNSRGVVPSIFRKWRAKWLWSEKPVAFAISDNAKSVRANISWARSTRFCVR